MITFFYALCQSNVISLFYRINELFEFLTIFWLWWNFACGWLGCGNGKQGGARFFPFNSYRFYIHSLIFFISPCICMVHILVDRLYQAWYYMTHRGWSRHTHESLLLHTLNYSISLLFHIFFVEARKIFPALHVISLRFFVCLFEYFMSYHLQFSQFFPQFCHRIVNIRTKKNRNRKSLAVSN